MTVVSICTDCKQAYTRMEWLDGWGRTGFCHQCAKHKELCHSNRYMSSCIRAYGHSGNHITNDGTEFIDDGSHDLPRALERQVDRMADVRVIIETVPTHQLAKEQPKPSGDGKLGWVVSEEIGAAMVNGRGASKELLDELNQKRVIE